MDVAELIKEGADLLIVKFPVLGTILAVVGLLPFLAQIIVSLTPSKEDDLKLEKFKKHSIVKVLWSFFLSFAPFKKDKEGMKLSNK